MEIPEAVGLPLDTCNLLEFFYKKPTCWIYSKLYQQPLLPPPKNPPKKQVLMTPGCTTQKTLRCLVFLAGRFIGRLDLGGVVYLDVVDMLQEASSLG